MLKPAAHTNLKVRAAIAGLIAWFGVLAAFSPWQTAPAAYASPERSSNFFRPQPKNRPKKYSEFPHSVTAHKMECNSCHKFPSPNWNKVRDAAAAYPDITDYPKHDSCLKCHRQQFFKGAKPIICSICHTNPSPRDSRRHPFPNPREIFDVSVKGRNAQSDFNIGFPHDKHIDIVSRSDAASLPIRNAAFEPRKAAEESCAVCHTTLDPQGDSDSEYSTAPPSDLGEGFWLKKGTFKSVARGHTTCFTCHSQDSGLTPAPSDCATCHKLKPKEGLVDFDPRLVTKMGLTNKSIIDAWRKRDSSGKFRHEWFSHAELSCGTCHNVQTINTLDLATKKVPVAACGTCHATATLDEGGAINFEIDSRNSKSSFQCTKCHIVFGSKAVPESHLRLLAAPSKE